MRRIRREMILGLHDGGDHAAAAPVRTLIQVSCQPLCAAGLADRHVQHAAGSPRCHTQRRRQGLRTPPHPLLTSGITATDAGMPLDAAGQLRQLRARRQQQHQAIIHPVDRQPHRGQAGRALRHVDLRPATASWHQQAPRHALQGRP